MEKLKFLSEFGCYGVSFEEAKGKIFGLETGKNHKTAGFVMDHKVSADGKNYYCVSTACYKAVDHFLLNVVFLTYDISLLDYATCDGFILPDSSNFKLPEVFFRGDNSISFSEKRVSPQLQAYINLISANGRPVLGIGMGAIMIAGMIGLKLYDQSTQRAQPTNQARPIRTIEDGVLRDVYGESYLVNPWYGPSVLKWERQSGGVTCNVRLYAVSQEGDPEAWGIPNQFLGLRWNPEYFDTKIFDWFINWL